MREPRTSKIRDDLGLAWACQSMSSITTLMTNGFVGVATPHYVERGGIPYFMAKNVRANEFHPGGHALVSQAFHESASKSRLQAGDILTVQTGHVGVSCLVPEEWHDSNAHALIISRCDSAKADSRFICQYLNSWFGRRALWSIQTGGGRPHLNTTDLQQVLVPVPPMDVQSTIADVLGNHDRACCILRQLSKARRKLKRGLLQQLLTGQRRFAEFCTTEAVHQTRYGDYPQDWQLVSIGDVASESTARAGEASDVPVLSCTKHHGLVSSAEYFGRRVHSEDTSGYKLVQRGEFAYATNHIEEGSIGLLTDRDAGLVSPMYTVFRTSGQVCTSFLYAVLKTERYRQLYQARTNASVDRRGGLRWEEFAKLPVALPCVKEQERIAEVLATLDRELSVLGRLKRAMADQKKGLMQQLLTGQIRAGAIA